MFDFLLQRTTITLAYQHSHLRANPPVATGLLLPTFTCIFYCHPGRYDVIVRDGFFSFQGKDRLPSSRRRDAGNNPFAKNSRKIPGKNKHSPIDRSTRSTHKKSKGNKRWKEVRKLDLLLQPGVSTRRTGGDDRSTGRPHGTHTSLPLYLFRLWWLAGRTQSRCRRRTTTNDPTTTTYYRELNGTGAGSAADRQSPVGVSCISSCALADDQPAGPDETQIGGLLSASSHADRWESGKLSPKLWGMRKLCLAVGGWKQIKPQMLLCRFEV